MARSNSPAEVKLRRLQALVRRPRPALHVPAMSRRLPEELTGEAALFERFTGDEVVAAEEAIDALVNDIRYEHLEGEAKEAVWYFAAESVLKRARNHVPDFLERHGRDPIAMVCYLPVEFLQVTQEVEVLGIRFLAVADERVPAAEGGFRLTLPVGSVAVANVSGTNYQRMAERARAEAAHVLRVLRVAFQANPGLHAGQLRFRLGDGYAFDDRIRGWRAPDDAAYELTVMEQLIDAAITEPVSKLPSTPTTDIEKKADLAVRWLERATLSGDPLVALLYLFFALEALLGRKDGKVKALDLAFRQTMLSHIVTGGFSDPNNTYFLYDEVRSAAVHGEAAPELDWRAVHRFAAVVRKALNDYLLFAELQRFTSRGRLLRALDDHPDRREMVDWLRQHRPPIWDTYGADASAQE